MLALEVLYFLNLGDFYLKLYSPLRFIECVE